MSIRTVDTTPITTAEITAGTAVFLILCATVHRQSEVKLKHVVHIP